MKTTPTAAGRFSHAGLIALALMVSLPFLMPEHTTPIPSFHEEWIAAVLGLAAGAALLGAPSMPVPGASLLALACAGLALLQMAVGPAPVPQLTALFVLYLLWAALLASVGSHLSSQFGRDRLARTLAVAILAGAILASLSVLFQPWLKGLGWTGYSAQRGGPLGQVNHFTAYLWLGLAAALYLRVTANIPKPAFWSAVGLLTFAVVLAGKRSSFLYAAALIGVAFWAARRDGGQAPSEERRLALGIGLVFVLLQPLAMLLPPIGDNAGPPPALRAFTEAGGPSVRLQLARLGMLGMKDAPALGNGIGSYSALSLLHADDIPSADNPGAAEHAHSLPIDLGAELGVPAALLVMLAAGIWLWRLRQRAERAEANWAAGVFAILGLHSLIEYPLWHAYFLGLAAVVAGAFGAHRQFGRGLAPVALTLGILAWGGNALFDLKRDYGLLESTLSLGRDTRTMTQAQAALVAIPGDSLLSPWVSTIACVSLDPLQVPQADGLAVCSSAMKFAPTVESGVNLAVLQWRCGETTKAQDLLRRLGKISAGNPGPYVRLAPLVTRDARLASLNPPAGK